VNEKQDVNEKIARKYLAVRKYKLLVQVAPLAHARLLITFVICRTRLKPFWWRNLAPGQAALSVIQIGVKVVNVEFGLKIWVPSH
jgi:hypothetical protein